jgi:hypothetical protein
VAGVYEHAVDRQSAYEILTQRSTGAAPAAPSPSSAPAPAPAPTQESGGLGSILGGLGDMFSGSSRRDTPMQAMVKSAARSIGSQVGRELIRGVLGSLLKKR